MPSFVAAPAANVQFILLPPLVEEVAVIAVALLFLLSVALTKLTVLEPCGSICHCVPGVPDTSDNKLPDVPVRVSAPVIV